MDNLYPLVDNVFRSKEVAAEFASLAAVIRDLPEELRLPVMLELVEHPPSHLMFQQMANLTLVFSPPKVGSTTIAETLRRHPAIHSSSKVRHIHYLSGRGVRLLEEQIARDSGRSEAQLMVQQLMLSRWIRMLLVANRAVRMSGADRGLVKKPTLIAGVREPIAQYLSAIFQIRWTYTDARDRIDADFIHARMFEDPWFQMYQNWYTEELAGVFNMDVVKAPFDCEQGWTSHENDDARLLFIRLESLDHLAEALGGYYRLDPATFEIARANETESKVYAAEYAALKLSFRLTPNELDRIYGAPHVRRFYSPQEIEGFRRYWGSGPTERRELDSSRVKRRPVPSALHKWSVNANGRGERSLALRMFDIRSLVRRFLR